MKLCNKCESFKSEEEFYFTNSKKLSRRATCILCCKQYHIDNIEKRRAQMRQYRIMNKETLSAYSKTEIRREAGRLSQKRNRATTRLRERNKRKIIPNGA
jgi:hypothetical protein